MLRLLIQRCVELRGWIHDLAVSNRWKTDLVGQEARPFLFVAPRRAKLSVFERGNSMMNDDHNEHEHNEHNEHTEHPGQNGHKEHPERQSYNPPQPDRLTKPREDALPIDFGDVKSDPWMPGLVEVEFSDPRESGVSDLEDIGERRSPAHEWKGELLKVLLDNQMSAWKPSFPLTYPWSKRSPDDLDKARVFYKERGRARFVTFRFSGKANVAEIAAELRNVPQINEAKPRARLLPSAINEPLLGSSAQVQPFASGLENQWYAFRCNLPDTLEQVTGDGVVIAVIDWGFDRQHPDYTDGIELRRNIITQSQGVGSGNCIHHGTGVLGLAGARRNSHGMVGFAPDSALWAIQAGEDQVMHPEYWMEAIEFVREQDSRGRRKVIILEAQTALGGNIEGDLTINQAISDAVASGIVVCVPAGNGNKDAEYDDLIPPRRIPETGSMLVGATDYQDAPLGNGGRRVKIYAPGDPAHDVTCTSLPQRHTNFFGGTSGAAAKVGGAVALLLQADKLLSPAEVKALLLESQTSVFQTTAKGETEEVGVLLDCRYAVYHCKARSGQAFVLTKSTTVV
ncbi:MAG TPA: S8 family serine peptidase [Pyrinomonadaceae bacterium]|nr:S8 family serine peptidase [Pyrinomonadaceae bacterium]